MSEGNNTNKDRIEATLFVIFQITISISVLVCLIGMIYCFVSFYKITNAVSTESVEILQYCKTILTSTDEEDSTINTISDEPTDHKNDIVNSLLTHMDSMVAIQESSNKNSLMSFIYGLLSSVLVGVCVVFVEKSRKNADEAKRNAEDAKVQAILAEQKAKDTESKIQEAKEATNEAKKSADDAKEQAIIAEEKARNTERAIEQATIATKEAKKSADDAKEQAIIAEEKARNTESAIEQATIATKEAHNAANQASEAGRIALESKHQLRLFIILSRIITFKSALLENNKIMANREIIYIRNEVCSVFHDDYEEYKRLNELYNSEVGKIEDELLALYPIIDSFRETCKKKYTGQIRKSMLIASYNYETWIKKAIGFIEEFGERTHRHKSKTDI